MQLVLIEKRTSRHSPLFSTVVPRKKMHIANYQGVLNACFIEDGRIWPFLAFKLVVEPFATVNIADMQ